ncbi:hypothetical protein K9L97_00150 [Candidatus Woesearchaeota archaeon]|nr:hypothetical protein [Candidatus Woesearchaeota archaeon]
MSKINKKLIKLTILSILILTITTIATPKTEAECNTNLSICSNYDITQTGFGAVELCGECQPCGISDGICPEDYTNGEIETDYNKTTVNYQINKNTRPQTLRENAPYKILPEDSTITGTKACHATYGNETTCKQILFKEQTTDEWIPTTNCETSLRNIYATNNIYIKVECENVKRTTGCQNCNDPDCKATITGQAWDKTNNESIQVNVNVVSHYNYMIFSRNTSLTNGAYSIGAPTGNIRIECTKEDYIPTQKDAFIQNGTTIVDCPMQEAYCGDGITTQICTMPNEYGEDVCKPRCEGRNGCEYQQHTTTDGKTYYASEVCEGLTAGATVNLEWIDEDETEMLYVECCSGEFKTRQSTKIKITPNKKIKNLLTKDYKKNIKGEPVTLKVIVYEK